ncbi:MAG TPA: acyl-CoA dehydrogenase family protein [Mycobacteriales bacterium]|nr:acyl-CoA dehydrogenase family protein [Mycobacteriales bacterium]
MDFALTDDQLSLQNLAREILSEQVTNDHLKALEAEAVAISVFDRGLWRQLAGAGLTGIAVPEEHGGAGLGFLELAVIFEEIGRAVAPVPAVATLVTAYVLGGSAPGAFADLLPGVGSGDTVLTTAFGDSADVKARRDGDHWVLDGEKGFVPYGAEADVVVVPAETDADVVLALVRNGNPGVTVTDLQTTNREPQALLGFGGARIDAADVIADGGAIYAELVRHHTSALAMVAAGVCQAALAMTAKHTIAREQFGKPIASFQAVGQRAADAYIDTELVRLTALQAAWRLSEGWPADDEIAVAKFWAGDGGMRVLHACQHLHGGLGVDLDYPLHRYFVWGKQIEHELGTPTRQLLELGAHLAATPV